MSLQQLLDEGIIDEVYQQLKTGKEAEVWLVSHRGEPVAAKIYKERDRRNFKNDAGYLEGRQVRNTRTQRAMDNRTAFGRKAAEDIGYSVNGAAKILRGESPVTPGPKSIAIRFGSIITPRSGRWIN